MHLRDRPATIPIRALDRIVEENKSGAYTQFVYSPTGFKMQIMSGQSVVKNFEPLAGGALAVYAGGNVYIRHADWLGSSRLTTNLPARTMYADTAYAPFGETYASSGSTDLSFTGMNQDTVSGLYDFPAREYSITGRWPSPDPAGLAAVDPTNPQSWNRYAYVLNNPLTYVDPSGLGPQDCESGDDLSDDSYCCEHFFDPLLCSGGGVGIGIGIGGGGGGTRGGPGGPTPLPGPPVNVGSPIDPATGPPLGGSPFIGVDDAAEALFCIIQPEICAAVLVAAVAVAITANQLAKKLYKVTVSCQIGDITNSSELTMLGYVQGSGIGANFQQAYNAAKKAAGALAVARYPTRRVYVRHCQAISASQ